MPSVVYRFIVGADDGFTESVHGLPFYTGS